MIQFFSKEEEQKVIRAIKVAEKNTSGEIRVHIEANCLKKPLVAAVETFHKLGMEKTAARNGVLIFIAPERREFAIIGDKGIDEKVEKGFWNFERDLLRQYFKKGAYCEGTCEVIKQIGEKLKGYFPYTSDDINELPDEISYG